MPFVTEINSPSTIDESSIAIVGLSCRFPGDASTPSKFWELLKNGQNGFSSHTNRYNAEAFFHPASGKRQNVIPTKGGYFLKEDPYAFDAPFFNITAAEAMALDPRQRIAMEVAYEALENAGISLERVAGTQTACYMGSSMSDYRDSVSRDFQHFPRYHILGMSDEMIANRISHFLDIHGPSATVQTACSSSLVATHIACQSLRCGESTMAIAGGVGLILGTEGTSHLNNLGFLNPAGHSRSFDADAAGYGRGEGCGVLIMKRLQTAIEDGDTIRAVIRASGANSDGWTPGVTMPSMDAQAALIKFVYESNKLDYSMTQYVEAHGTGTKVGDPVEAGAIYHTIGQNPTTRKPLYVGSLKPNIGHLEAAAGVASIIKGVLALEHGQIPPNINLKRINPAIPLQEWNMVVPTELTPWPAAQVKRMSISGFGMGGTNAHVVLEAFSNPVRRTKGRRLHPTAENSKRLFTFSSQDKAGFERIGKALTQHLDGLGAAGSSASYSANLAHTLGQARSGLAWRTSAIVEDIDALRDVLTTSLGEEAVRAPNHPPRIGFVFTGQGAQWARMGIEIMERPTIRRSVEQSTMFLKDMGCDWDPITELSRDAKESRLGTPQISQPICTVLQIALVEELRSWGITPSAVVGHSSGEIGAAYTIGALSHRDAIAAAFYRGIVASTPKMKQRGGGMMAVGASPEDVRKLLDETKLEASIACINSPSSVTVSGNANDLEALRAVLDARGTFARRLKVDVAYHSGHMHSCSMEYYAAISEIGQTDTEESSIRMVSSVTGNEVDLDDLGPYYWVQNMISPVLFTDAVKECVAPANATKEGNAVDYLIEIGPHSALGGPIEQILSKYNIENVGYTSMLVRGQSALDTSLSLAAEVYRQGVTIDVARVNGDLECRLLTNLPPYAWNHSKQFRADGRLQREQYFQPFPTQSLLGAMQPTMDERAREWRSFVRLDEEPWLRGHVVGNSILFPAAAMVSVVIEAAQQILDHLKTPETFVMRDISLVAAMPLYENEPTEIIVRLQPNLMATADPTSDAGWEFTVSSCTGTDQQIRENCRGLIKVTYEEGRSTHLVLEDAKLNESRIADYYRVHEQCPDSYSKEYFYDCYAKAMMKYDEIWQGVESCHPGKGQSCYTVKITDIGETFTTGKSARPFLIHAATLDAIWQGCLGSTRENVNNYGEFGLGRPMVPTFIGELEISANVPADVGYIMPGVCHSQSKGFNELSSDMHMFDTDLSKVLVSVTDYRLSMLDMVSEVEEPTVDPTNVTFEVRWNYAMDCMETTDYKQALLSSKHSTTDAAITQLITMLVHRHPTLKIVELAQKLVTLPNAIVPTLLPGTILPSQIQYALLEHQPAESQPTDIDDGLFGGRFNLSESHNHDITPADLIILPCGVNKYLQDSQSFDPVFEQLLRIAKPSTMFALASTPKATYENDVICKMNAEGFETIPVLNDNIGCVTLFKKQRGDDSDEHSKDTPNGNTKQEIVIIQTISPSQTAQVFASELQAVLKTKCYSSVIQNGLDKLEEESEKIYISLLELENPVLKSLAESDFQLLRKAMVSCDKLLWITCGDSPSLEIVDGLARCVNVEVAGSKFQVFHLSPDGLQHGPRLVGRILESSPLTGDNEFRERNGLLQVPRVFPSPKENGLVREHLEDTMHVMSLHDGAGRDKSACSRLSIGKPGLLSSLHFVRDNDSHASPLGDDELELEIKASGLNFRDVMASMGLVPVPGFGMEASGIVIRAGRRAAESFKPGDRVSTMTTGGTHATKARCDARVTAKIPEAMSFQEGAAAPVVYSTAYTALIKLAKLQKGQSILIHAAAGGVGQATIQLAQHLGLTIYVTVGTDDKRQFLKEKYGIAPEHMFNSRDSSFAKGIRRITNGRGVDCVLNSLSGELLLASWDCLAHFGTFIEIGTRNIVDNTRLDMRVFGRGTTFTAFDIPTLIQEDPTSLGHAMNEAFKLLGTGIVALPYPITSYPAGQAEDAFRVMQQGKHRGKIILSFSKEDTMQAPVLRRAKDSLELDADATYLFVGGLGGLGRSLATEFVASGARHIAFMSRSGDTESRAKATVKELRALGADVTVLRADVSDKAAFTAAMKQCAQQLPPIKGVIQMAMVLRDALVENMSYDEWCIPLRPKVAGTWNLHDYFGSHHQLDFMIFCSSFSGLCGSPGQAQYGAGNTYQDALACYRRSQGLKAVSIDLGIMLDVGILADMGDHTFKQWEEALGVHESTFRAVMKNVINAEQGRRPDNGSCPAHICLGLGSADLMATLHLPNPPWFEDPRFGPLTTASSTSSTDANLQADGGASLAARLVEAGNAKDFDTAGGIITDALVKKLADILRMPESEIDPGRPLYTYGVDSLVSLEVRNWITRELKANVPLFDILAAVPIEKFAAQIASKSKLLVD